MTNSSNSQPIGEESLSLVVERLAKRASEIEAHVKKYPEYHSESQQHAADLRAILAPTPLVAGGYPRQDRRKEAANYVKDWCVRTHREEPSRTAALAVIDNVLAILAPASPSPEGVRTAQDHDQSVGGHRHDRHPWCQPGDEPDRVYVLKFSDPDCREQLWTSPDAEAQAWAAWDMFAPTFNCTLFATVRQSERPTPDPLPDTADASTRARGA